MSKRFVGCGLAVLGAAVLFGQAQAADLPVKVPPLVVPPPVMSWTGFYVGVNGGFGGDKVEYPFTIGGIPSFNVGNIALPGVAGVSGSASVTSSGFFGGGQIGYNFQFAPSWVVGVETDFQGSDIKGELNLSVNTAGVSATAGTKLDWFGTVRGRFGYLVTPSALVYATGGWAYGQTTTSLSAGALGASVSASFDHDKSGWTLGGGLEYALTNSLTFKTEYLYMDLGTDNITSGALLGIPYSIEETTTVHLVRAGLNFRF
jgi:outer membrane immunogenic protein